MVQSDSSAMRLPTTRSHTRSESRHRAIDCVESSSCIEFRFLVTAYLFCLIVGQMVKPKIGSTPITLIDVVILLMLPIVLLRLRARLSVFLALGIFLAPNVLFGIMYFRLGEIGPKHLLMGFYSCYRFLFPFLIIFAYASRLHEKDKRFCLRLVMWGVWFHLVFGIVQAALVPNFAVRFGPKDVDWDVQGHRLVSTILDPNLISSLFYATVLGVLSRVASTKETVSRRALLTAVAAVIAGALTASRGGALGFSMAFLLLLVEAPRLDVRRKIRWIFVTALSTVVVIGIFFTFFGSAYITRTNRFGASNLSVQERLINIAIDASVFFRHPLFGKGFNFLPYLPSVDFVSVTGNYADGGLLYLLASVGIVGVVAICLILYRASHYFRSPRVLIYPTIMLVIQSTSTASMYYPLLTIFVVLLSLGLDGQTSHTA